MIDFNIHDYEVGYDEFLSTKIDDLTRRDLENYRRVYHMIPDKPHELVLSNLTNDYRGMISHAGTDFDLYDDPIISERVSDIVNGNNFSICEGLPFSFGTKMFIGPNSGLVCHNIMMPRVMDDTSHIFLGHEIHHALKDSEPNERKLRDRFAEVIPIFYELVSANIEDDFKIKNKILNARMILLIVDKAKCNLDNIRCIQYYNSFYYALCLYSKYKENPKEVLRLVTKVLNHIINTEQLLKILNVYDDPYLDDVFDYEYKKVFCK